MESSIYFYPEAYVTTGPRLMGRNAVGESFLSGYLKYATCSTLRPYVESQSDAEVFTEIYAEQEVNKPVSVISRLNLASTWRATGP